MSGGGRTALQRASARDLHLIDLSEPVTATGGEEVPWTDWRGDTWPARTVELAGVDGETVHVLMVMSASGRWRVVSVANDSNDLTRTQGNGFTPVFNP